MSAPKQLRQSSSSALPFILLQRATSPPPLLPTVPAIPTYIYIRWCKKIIIWHDSYCQYGTTTTSTGGLMLADFLRPELTPIELLMYCCVVAIH